MATEVQIALQPQAGQDPAATLAAAAAKLARSSLEMLVQQAGQPLTGRIVPPPPNLPAGFSQVAIADMVLTLKLSAPLPPGTPVRIDVQQTPSGQPAVTVQPLPQNAAPTPAPATPAPQAQIPLPPAPQPAPQAQQPLASQTQVTQSNPPPPAPRAALPTPRQPVPASVPPPQPGASVPAAAPAAPTPAPVATAAPQAAPPQMAAVQVQSTAPAPVPPTAPSPVSPTAASPVSQTTPMPQSAAPSPQVAVTTATPQPAGPPSAPPAPQPMPGPQVATTIQPGTTQPRPAPAPALAPSSPTTATPTPAAPTAPQPQTAAQQPLPTPPTSQPAAPVNPAPAQTLVQRLTQAFTSPPAATPTPPPPVPGSPAQVVLAATTQAAAQQQSPGPLLQALAVSLPQLPKPVADAAERVLSARVSLDRGAPTADGLKQAVLRSGVFLGAPARPDASPDLRQALSQLRGTLLAWLGDDIAPVAAVGRRPPPPARGAMPRAQMPELPQPAEGSPKDAGKSLLTQTEGALARIRLMQLGSHAPEAARPGAPLAAPSEWNLELPLMLGHELAMAQIQIQRDGKGKAEAREKSWRLRFALKFSVLGEVGAQVAMVGARTSIAIWADEPQTADTLEAMLPELAPALAAKGLELASLTVRRSAPRDESQPAGRLMDSLR